MRARVEKVDVLGWNKSYIGVISGMKKPKAIGSKSTRRNGRETFILSEKRPISVLRRVITQWLVWFNWSGYFFIV